MPIFDAKLVGDIGVVADVDPLEAPPNSWSFVRNMRMHQGRMIAFQGQELGSVNPDILYFKLLGAVTSRFSSFWVGAGRATGGPDKLVVYDGTSWLDITGAALLADADAIYTGDILNDNYVVTNNDDAPRYWDGNVGNTFLPLPGWDADWRCQSLRAHKGFLIALDMTETGGERYPYRVRWSDAAPPGGVPQNWAELDPTSLAGAQDLGDATSSIRAGLPLRDTFVIYTEKDIIGMQLVGGSRTWRFYSISRQAGCLAPNAVASVRGHHIVLSDGDVFRTDGQVVESILDRRTRRLLFDIINEDRQEFSFIQVNRQFQEVWVCIPAGNNQHCSRALVWNWNTGAVGIRDLPVECYTGFEALDIRGLNELTWDDIDFPWDAWSTTWNAGQPSDLKRILLLGGGDTLTDYGGAPVFIADRTNTFDGAERRSFAQRLGLDIEGDRRVTIHEVWPRATGGPVTVRIGGQEQPNGAVEWKATKTFDPEQDKHVSCRVSTRYPALYFESRDPAGFSLSGYRVHYSVRGTR